MLRSTTVKSIAIVMILLVGLWVTLSSVDQQLPHLWLTPLVLLGLIALMRKGG